jgi:hypothetical protein
MKNPKAPKKLYAVMGYGPKCGWIFISPIIGNRVPKQGAQGVVTCFKDAAEEMAERERKYRQKPEWVQVVTYTLED